MATAGIRSCVRIGSMTTLGLVIRVRAMVTEWVLEEIMSLGVFGIEN